MTFEAKPAVREAVGLLIGLVGPSGGGKTFSALRMATGIQHVVGGDIDVIDTENGRALYYADKFKFNHVRFPEPFSSLRYLEAIRYCAKRGTKTILVDSMSHEHDGVGGLLEQHELELQRIAGNDYAKREKVKMLAWAKPKQARKKLINELLQLNVNLIATFRAKEKIKIVRGKEPEQLGWMPISGDEFMYEMVLQALLKPGSGGVPSWGSEFEGERSMMKLPTQFRSMFIDDNGEARAKPIDEQLGEQLAQWAAGGSAKPAQAAPAWATTCEGLIHAYNGCGGRIDFDALEKRRADAWKNMPTTAKNDLKAASDAALKRIEAAT